MNVLGVETPGEVGRVGLVGAPALPDAPDPPAKSIKARRTKGQGPAVNPLLGAHMSVAGGLPRAVERAVAHRCDALQIFAKNANQWHGRPLAPAEIREFRAKVEEAGIGPVVSHAGYLINLATTSPGLHRQSME